MQKLVSAMSTIGPRIVARTPANSCAYSVTRLFTPPPPVVDKEKFNGFIPINQVSITYSKSTGPGGQNVNNVNTKVDLRFDILKATWIPDATKPKLIAEHNTKISKCGQFIVRSDLTRSRHLNLADALEKLRGYIRSAETEPKAPSEESLERIRRRHERAARERLLLKNLKSLTKQSRQAPQVHEC